MNQYKKYNLFFFVLFVLSSCGTGIDHHYLIDVYDDGSYRVELNANGEYDDFLDYDATVPIGKDWYIINNLMYDDVENHEYKAEKIFQPNSSFPRTFYKGDSINISSLLNHPGDIKFLNLFFLKIYKFKIIYEGRKLKTNYPLFAAPLDTGWAYESLSHLFNETLLRSNLEFNLNAIIERDLNDWLSSDVINKSDDEIFNNYLDYKNEGLNVIMLPSPIKKHKEIESIYHDLESQLKLSAELLNDTFIYHLIMPGVLDSTNANDIAGDTLKWKIELKNYLEDDFTMYASSYIFSLPKLIILLCLLISFIFFGKIFFQRK